MKETEQRTCTRGHGAYPTANIRCPRCEQEEQAALAALHQARPTATPTPSLISRPMAEVMRSPEARSLYPWHMRLRWRIRHALWRIR